MLDSWLPFLIYGLFALAIPTSMIVMSFVFSQRPRARTRARGIPFESGVSLGPPKQQRFTISFYLTAMRRTPASPSGSSAIRPVIFAAARSVRVTIASVRSTISMP